MPLRSFRLEIHPAALPWTPSEEELRALQRAYPNPKYRVRIWPRSLLGKVLDQRLVDEGPWAFRAITRGLVSEVFVDATETPDSVAWVIGHELCHQKLRLEEPDRLERLNRDQPTDLHPASDAFHLHDPEERACDRAASRILGYTTDRPWWRARTPSGGDGTFPSSSDLVRSSAVRAARSSKLEARSSSYGFLPSLPFSTLAGIRRPSLGEIRLASADELRRQEAREGHVFTTAI